MKDGPIWALGLMSGTSLDGVDAALLKTDGVEITAFGPGRERAYEERDIARIRRPHQNWQRFRPPEDMGAEHELANAERDVRSLHAQAVMELLTDTEISPGLIGFHGQTIAHDPEAGWTWQLGDGAALARVLNRDVVWDFRTDDMRAGGEGAPLAPFYHWALARHIGATAPVAFLNIGGVANVTWVDPTAASPEADGALLAFDTGTGNALLNDWMMRRAGQPFDKGGEAAARGNVDWMTLHSNNAATAYFERKPPKSLDRNTFAAVLKSVEDLSTDDGAATLTAFTVEGVVKAVEWMPSPPARWLVCGGGRKNATMMGMLADRLKAQVEPVEAAGLDGDMLEAQAFAYLAVRVARGLPTSAPGTTGCAQPVCGGQVSVPR